MKALRVWFARKRSRNLIAKYPTTAEETDPATNIAASWPSMPSNGQTEELRARGMPLGLMPGMGYEEKEAVLETGDAALFYSDGLIEAHDPKGEMFGVPRLRRLVAECAAEGGSLADFLMETLSSFTGEGWEQEDDITLVTLRRSAASR